MGDREDLRKFFGISENVFGIKVSEAEKRKMTRRWLKGYKIMKEALAKIIKERKVREMKKVKTADPIKFYGMGEIVEGKTSEGGEKMTQKELEKRAEESLRKIDEMITKNAKAKKTDVTIGQMTLIALYTPLDIIKDVKSTPEQKRKAAESITKILDVYNKARQIYVEEEAMGEMIDIIGKVLGKVKSQLKDEFYKELSTNGKLARLVKGL